MINYLIKLYRFLTKKVTWLWFLIIVLIIWLLSIIVIIKFQDSKCNKWLINELSGSINISDAINLGVAIGTIALTVFGASVIKQYKKQKTIDLSLECIKQTLSLLFFHKCKLDSKFMTLNNTYLSAISILKNNSVTIIYPQDKLSALQKHINDLEIDVNNFTNDWAKIIGTQLTILNKIQPNPAFKKMKEKINSSIIETTKCFDLVKTYSCDQPINNLYSDHILIVNEIYQLHEEVLKYFESILELDKKH